MCYIDFFKLAMVFNENLSEIHFKINFSYLFILHRSGP